MSKSVNTYATSHAVVLAGLNTSTTYYLMVEAIDTSDNSATSSEISFSTQDGPVISNVSVSQVFNEKATIFWLTDISADSYVYYSTSTQGPFLSTGKTESVTQHEITIENLEPGTRYYFYVKSSNALDNNGGEYYTFVTTNDTKPPEISNLSAWTTAYTAVIVWQTDEVSDSYIEWGTSSGSYTFSTSSDVDTIYHVIRLTDLTENQTYYYKVRSTDPNGNQTESSQASFKPVRERDTTPPVISNVSVSDVYTTQAKISWQTDEISDSIVEYSTSSDFSASSAETDSQMVKSHSVVLTGLLPNTTYYFRVKSKDVEANEAQESGFSFTTLDGPIISNVVVSQVFNERATIEWQTNVLATSTVIYSLNSDFSSYFEETDNEEVLNHTITLTGLTPGAVYYFYVKSGNAIDNNGGDYYFFSTANDTDAPQISNISVLERANSALILWETDELSTSKIIYGTSSGSLDDEVSDNVLTRKHHVLTLSGLNENTKYYFKVASCDANLNCATSTLNSFTTLLMEEPKEGDTEGPQISEVLAQVISTSSAVISWKTNEISDSRVNYGTTTDYTQSVSSSDLTIEHIINLSNLKPSTTYHFQVVSTDSSGNTSTSTDYTFTTKTPDDLTPPNITNVTVSSLTLNSAVISWTTDENSNSIVDYGETTSLGQIAGNFDDSTTTHSVTLTNLNASTTYYFQVRSQDSAGNTATDNNSGNYYSFTTLKDTTPPIITSGPTASVIDRNSATIVWTTDEPSTSQVEYSTSSNLTNSSLTTEITDLHREHSVVISGLTASTTYYYRVISKDSSGNSTTSAIYSFTTATTKEDVIPPTISNVASSTTLNSVTITWTTDEESNSIVDYGTTKSLGLMAGNVDELTLSHSVTITGLSASTTYYFQVRSQDSAGNTATDNNSGNYYSFTTLKDTTPPIITEVSVSTVSDTKATIVWKTNELSTSQVIYGTTASYGSQTEEDTTLTYQHSVTLTGLTKKTTYHFKVVSKDSAGNSTSSADYTFTTTDEPGIVERIGGGILVIEKIPEGYKSEKEWCEEMGLYWYEGECHRISREETRGLTKKEEESLSLIESGTEEFLEKVLEKI